jgi:hypothetical protein
VDCRGGVIYAYLSSPEIVPDDVRYGQLLVLLAAVTALFACLVRIYGLRSACRYAEGERFVHFLNALRKLVASENPIRSAI